MHPANATATAPWLTLAAGREAPFDTPESAVDGARDLPAPLAAPFLRPLGGGALGPSATGPTGLAAGLGGTAAAVVVVPLDAGARAARPLPLTTCEARGSAAARKGATGTTAAITTGRTGATSGGSPRTRSAGRARCTGRLRRGGVERVLLDGGGAGGGADPGGGTTTLGIVHELIPLTAPGGVIRACVAGVVASSRDELVASGEGPDRDGRGRGMIRDEGSAEAVGPQVDDA